MPATSLPSQSNWHGEESVEHLRSITEIDGKVLLKTEVMPDGKTKQILKDPETDKIIEQIL